MNLLSHVLRLACSLSKITPFLTNQVAQQVVMIISLEMMLPNASLASITMWSGCRFMFQLMGIVFHQDILKGHSKNR